jgi:hypothetical protein
VGQKTHKGIPQNDGPKKSKGEVQPTPKPTWIQTYLPGLYPDQPVELIEPKDPETEGVFKP